jgi:hypothetical protein
MDAEERSEVLLDAYRLERLENAIEHIESSQRFLVTLERMRDEHQAKEVASVAVFKKAIAKQKELIQRWKNLAMRLNG